METQAKSEVKRKPPYKLFCLLMLTQVWGCLTLMGYATERLTAVWWGIAFGLALFQVCAMALAYIVGNRLYRIRIGRLQLGVYAALGCIRTTDRFGVQHTHYFEIGSKAGKNGNYAVLTMLALSLSIGWLRAKNVPEENTEQRLNEKMKRFRSLRTNHTRWKTFDKLPPDLQRAYNELMATADELLDQVSHSGPKEKT